jgi:hypothetical protein
MAVIAANIRLIKATFKLGTDTYTEHVSQYEFVPNTPSISYTDVGGVVHKLAADESDWALNLTLLQDFSATGLAKYMLDHAGDEVEVEIVDGPATWTADVTCVPPRIGGAPKTVGTSQLALPSSKPTWAATPA